MIELVDDHEEGVASETDDTPGSNARLVLDLLRQCKVLSLPNVIHESLLEAFGKSLVRGGFHSNVIPILISAYETWLRTFLRK